MELRHLRISWLCRNLEFHQGRGKTPFGAALPHAPDPKPRGRDRCASSEPFQSQVSLTEEGRSFLVDAKRLLALAAESVQSVQRLSRGENRPVEHRVFLQF